MPGKTSIQWTDLSSNPIKYRDASGKVVWGCVKVSAGCTHCYAEALGHRYGKGGLFNAGVMAGLTPFLDEKEVGALLRSKAISGKRVFVGDMTDVFGEWVTDEMLDRLFAVFALRPDVTFQVLTKRPERMRRYVSEECHGEARESIVETAKDILSTEKWGLGQFLGTWPLPNVWLGTSCEDQAAADVRIPELLATPAAVRFLSCEPLLGPIDLDEASAKFNTLGTTEAEARSLNEMETRLHWVIAGGESGPGARPHNLYWSYGLKRQCYLAGVAFFMKQMGSQPVLDGGLPVRRIQGDAHGSHIESFPEGLRVREFPTSPGLRPPSPSFFGKDGEGHAAAVGTGARS